VSRDQSAKNLARQFVALVEQYEREESEGCEACFITWCNTFRQSKRNPSNVWRDCKDGSGAEVRVTVFFDRDRDWWRWAVASTGGVLRYSHTHFGDRKSALRDLWMELGRP